MKLLQNSKFTGPALILLLVLNTTLLVLLLVKHPAPPAPPEGPGMPPGGGPRDYIVHELKMDDLQQKSYDALIKDHRSHVEQIQKNMRMNRDSLVSQLSVPTIDTAKINSLSEKIGSNQAEMEKVNFYHFKNVRGICTPEQQPKFDTIIRGALRMMGPPQGQRPNGPPPPRRDGQGPPPPRGEGPPPPPPGDGPPPPPDPGPPPPLPGNGPPPPPGHGPPPPRN